MACQRTSAVIETMLLTDLGIKLKYLARPVQVTYAPLVPYVALVANLNGSIATCPPNASTVSAHSWRFCHGSDEDFLFAPYH